MTSAHRTRWRRASDGGKEICGRLEHSEPRSPPRRPEYGTALLCAAQDAIGAQINMYAATGCARTDYASLTVPPATYQNPRERPDAHNSPARLVSQPAPAAQIPIHPHKRELTAPTPAQTLKKVNTYPCPALSRLASASLTPGAGTPKCSTARHACLAPCVDVGDLARG
ncbi:hypothetical protein MSAN_00898300 [Mycena sanguinolenta]|uniref:Uncharacterized protein n=1 Tax=Mycena sanguinolenta TaxID=230812 RepID=A0A8H7D8R2_9AGAR|nr:hypothetical protein MSAN_00898300 [Mycena sanguinolenta]